MFRAIAPLICSSFLMVSCGAHDSDQAGEAARHGANEADSGQAQGNDAQGDDPNPNHSSVVAEVSGDRADKINSVGSLGTVSAVAGQTKTLLTISGARDDSEEKGVTVSVTAGMPAMAELSHGTTVDNAIGTVSYRPAAEKTEFSSMFNYLFYLPPKGGQDAATVTIDKVEKLSSENRVARYRLVGHFSFNATSTPEPMSDACMLDATKAVGRVPSYNPTVCGAQRLQVTGHFDSMIDVMEQ